MALSCKLLPATFKSMNHRNSAFMLQRLAVVFAALMVLALVMPGLSPVKSAVAETSQQSNPLDMTLKSGVFNGDASEKLDFLSGEPFNVNVRMTASEGHFPGAGGQLRLKIRLPKNPHIHSITWPDTTLADQIIPEDTSEWQGREYVFTTPQAIDTTIAIGVTFKNDTTPDGVTWQPEAWLYRAGAQDTSLEEVRNTQRTFTIHSKAEFEPVKEIQKLSRHNYSGDEVVNRPNGEEAVVRYFDVYSQEAHGVVPPANRYGAVDYNLGLKFRFDPNENPHAYGRYLPERVRLVDIPPAGSQWDALNQGWELLPGTSDRYYKDFSRQDLLGPRPEISGPTVMRDGILGFVRLGFEGLSAHKYGDSNTPFTFYTNTLQAYDISNPSVPPVLLGERTRDVAFETRVVPPLATESMSMWKRAGSGKSQLTLLDGSLYSKENNNLIAVDSNNPEAGFMFDIGVQHYSRDGRFGSLDDMSRVRPAFIRSVVDTLPDGLRATGIRMTHRHLTQYPESQRYYKQALNGAGLVVYGIKGNGDRVVLDSDLQVEEMVPINDPEGEYRSIEISSTQPVPISLWQVNFELYATLTPAELQAINGKFGNQQECGTSTPEYCYYKNKARLRYVWDPSSTSDYIEDDDALVSIIKHTRTVDASLMTYTPNRVYNNCEANVNITQPYTPSNCTRIARVITALNLNNQADNLSFSTPVKSIRSVVLVPPGFEYLRLPPAANSNDNLLALSVQQHGRLYGQDVIDSYPVKVVENYKGTGKTALISDLPDLNSTTRYEYSGRTLDIDVTRVVPSGTYEIEHYFSWGNQDQIIPAPGHPQKIVADVLDIDGDGNTEEKILREVKTINVTGPNDTVARKNVAISDPNVSGDQIPADKWSMFSGAVDAQTNKILHYRLQVQTGLNDYQDLPLTIIDALPQANDHRMVSQSVANTAARHWTSEAVDGKQISGNSSHIETPLRKPIDKIILRSSAGERDITANATITYSRVTQGPDMATYGASANWLSAAEVGNDWTSIRAFRIVIPPADVPQNATVSVYTEHNVKPLTGETINTTQSGVRGVNSFVMSRDNGNSYQETNLVRTEFVKYKVRGVAFLDTVKDGLYKEADNEQRVDSIDAYLIGEDGQLYHQNSVPIHSQVSVNGEFGYDFDVFKRGKYRVAFVRQNPERYGFTSTPETDFAPYAHHVVACAHAAAGSAPTAENCADPTNQSSLVGFSDWFTLDPSNRLVERNVGLISTAPQTYEAAWLKTTTSNHPLGGSQWLVESASDAIVPAVSMTVSDCVSDPCPQTGGDIDPAPGRFRIAGLLPGSYTLSEDKAPLGYTLDTTLHSKQVDAQSAPNNWGTFQNQLQTVPQIPLTGGLGSDIFLILGGGILFTGLLTTASVVRRRPEGN